MTQTRAGRTRWVRAGAFLAMGVAVLCVLTGCAVHGAPTGHLAGVTYYESGLAPSPKAVEAVVVAIATSGNVGQSWTVTSANDGSFALDLPPGTYLVAGVMTRPGQGGYFSPTDVTIPTGLTTAVQLHCFAP